MSTVLGNLLDDPNPKWRMFVEVRLPKAIKSAGKGWDTLGLPLLFEDSKAYWVGEEKLVVVIHDQSRANELETLFLQTKGLGAAAANWVGHWFDMEMDVSVRRAG